MFLSYNDVIPDEVAIGGMLGTIVGFSLAVATLSSSTLSGSVALALGVGFSLGSGYLGMLGGCMLFSCKNYNPIQTGNPYYDENIRFRH